MQLLLFIGLYSNGCRRRDRLGDGRASILAARIELVGSFEHTTKCDFIASQLSERAEDGCVFHMFYEIVSTAPRERPEQSDLVVQLRGLEHVVFKIHVQPSLNPMLPAA